MLNIYVIKQKEKVGGYEFGEMLQDVSETTRKKIGKFLKWQDAQRTLIGELLIRNVICNKLGLSNEEIKFERNVYGKPFLKYYRGFFFNLSHAGEWIVCAVNDNEVGVDIEKIMPTDFGIAKRYFSGEEYGQLILRENEQRLDYFYDLWTLKESYVKAIGKGLSMPLRDFTVNKSGDGIFFKHNMDERQYTFKQYDIGQGYKLSVCVAGEIKEERLIIKTLGEVIDRLNN